MENRPTIHHTNGGAPEGAAPRASSLRERLAQAVFQRPESSLDASETALLTRLQTRYKTYLKTVAKAARELQPGKTKLHAREYQLIDTWFFQPLPLTVVLRGIEVCRRRAREKGTPVYSLRYAQPIVTAEYQYYCQRNAGSQMIQDPWGIQS